MKIFQRPPTRKTNGAEGFLPAFLFLSLAFATLRASGYASYAGEVLENWTFDDASGTTMQDATNLAGSAQWNVTDFSTDGSGNLLLDPGSDLWHRSATLPQSLPPGKYEIKWHVATFDLTASSITDNCGAAFALGTLLNVRLQARGSSSIAITVAGGPDGWKLLKDFGARSLSDLTIRAVYNTLADTVDVYYKLGTGAEAGPYSYAANTNDVAELKGNLLTANMGTGDSLLLDYFRLTVVDVDTDGDGIFNGNDPDDDNDGYDDVVDVFPLDPTEWADADGNGVGDNVQFDQSVLDVFSNKFGVVLSAGEHDALAKAVKPFVKEAWRTNAEARIDQYRKANLTLRVLDADGNPLPGARVHVELRKKKFLFGAALPMKNVLGDSTYSGITTARYRELILDFCDAVGANNAFKPRLRRYLMGNIDDFLTWAGTNDLPVRAHLLMWPCGNGRHLPFDTPTFSPNYPVSNLWATAEANPSQANVDNLRDAVDFQIADWASRWTVTQWDVINENSDGNVLTNLLGEHCVVDWFTNAAAHVVDPNTKLFVNDYDMIAGDRTLTYISNKVNRFKQFVEYLQTNNAPLHGIGLQSHFGTYHVQPEEIYSRLNEFAAYGLELAGTEFNFDATVSDEEQARRTAETMTEYFSHPSVGQLLSWTLVHSTSKGLIDEATGKPRLQGLAWYYLNRMAWTTDTNLTCDASGEIALRSFKGDYDVIVSYGGRDYLASLWLDADATNHLVLPDVELADVEQYWNFDDARGTAMSAASNLEGSAAWNTSSFATDGRGNLPVSGGVSAWHASATLPSPPTSGKYELKWRVDSFDLTHTNTSDNCGIAMNLGDLLSVRLYASGTNALALTAYDPGWTMLQTFGRAVTDLTIRAVYDLDTKTVDVYLKSGLGNEQRVGTRLAAKPSGTADALSGKLLAGSMAEGDAAKLDYVMLRHLSPATLYADWTKGYPSLGAATNAFDDPDGDGAVNLKEYAVGGNPEDAGSVGHSTAETRESGAGGDQFRIVFARRTDYASRGLSYFVEETTNLTDSTVWTAAPATQTGTGQLDAEFESVTNVVTLNPNANREFIRLRVQKQ